MNGFSGFQLRKGRLDATQGLTHQTTRSWRAEQHGLKNSNIGEINRAPTVQISVCISGKQALLHDRQIGEVNPAIIIQIRITDISYAIAVCITLRLTTGIRQCCTVLRRRHSYHRHRQCHPHRYLKTSA